MTLQKDEKAVQAARCLNVMIYRTDRALFDRASDLQTKLGLGGFWKGGDLALAEIIKALHAEKYNSEMTKQVQEEKVNELANEDESGQGKE